jgi:hypothetical protein
MVRARNTRALGVAAVVVAGAATLAGCGGSDYENKLRPPATKIVSAYISDDAVSISPAKLGGGPITLVITNQAGTPQTLTLETAGDEAGTTRTSAQVDPSDTTSLKAVVETGRYTLTASSDGIRRAVLRVGAERPSAQNDLQLP